MNKKVTSFIVKDIPKRVLDSKRSLILFILSVAFFVTHYFFESLYETEFLSKLGIGIAVAFILDFIFILIESFEKVKLRQFFGKLGSDEPFYLVYPEFELSDGVATCIKALEIPETRIYKVDEDWNFQSVKTNIFIPKAVASNDIQALLIVYGFLKKNRVNVVISPVKNATALEVKSSNHISFGLTSNNCSIMCITKSNMCDIEEHDDNKYHEKVVVSLDKNKRYEFKSSGQHQIGIICRHSIRPDDEPGERWLMCGGIGPIGTIAAAQYLIEQWQLIAQEVGDQDFVAIVEDDIFPKPMHAPKLLLIKTKDGAIKPYNHSRLEKFKEHA